MKFGDTLWQRSVPQWRNFNIDYQTLKTYVKDSTSPSKQYLEPADNSGKAKAISIPVPGKRPTVNVAPNLEEKLFVILKKEHDRVGLFVRSKWYEIGSRLGSIERQLSQLQRRKVVGPAGAKNQVKLRAKFSKIETDILSVGNELQNIARFVSINRLAIRKLVKKFQKWAGSTTLSQRVQTQLLDQPDSFTKTDLAQALARYTTFLSAVREPFRDQPPRDGSVALDAHSTAQQEKGTKSSLALVSLLQKSEIDFDAAMALHCKSEDQDKAVYWVLQDNIVELRILLLQHMRYASFGGTPKAGNTSPTDSGKIEGEDGKATCTGAIVLEKSKSQAVDDKSSTASAIPNSTPTPAAIARWTTSGDARVCMLPTATEADPMGIKSIVKLEKDRLLALLPLDPAARRNEISRLTDEELYATSDDDKAQDNALRGYIQRNVDLKPVARIVHKRSRFVGLENSSHQGFWACLDEDVKYAKMSGNERKPVDVYKVPEETGQRFPHAVLSLKAEGANPTLLSVLDSSHLTERVPNFSLEAHAYSVCNSDPSKENPPWLSKLATDIRHIPEVSEEALSQSRTCSRKSSNIEQLTNSSSNKSQTPNLTSGSGTTASHGPVTPDTEVFAPPAVSAPIKKQSKSELIQERASERSRRLRDRKSQRDLLMMPQIEQPKYWNEYDNPGSEMGGGDNEAFYVYVDPDAPLFPGQIVLTRWGQNLKDFFGRALKHESHGPDEERQFLASDNPKSLRRQISQLLSVDSGGTSSDDDDDDVADADADDELSHYIRPSARVPPNQGLNLNLNPHASQYGTFSQSRLASSSGDRAPADIPEAWLGVSSLCFTAALLIETAMSILLSTSRRSLQGEVDFAVVVGVIASLCFASIGIGACSRRRSPSVLRPVEDNPDTIIRGAKATLKGICFVVICVWAGVLVALSLI